MGGDALQRSGDANGLILFNIHFPMHNLWYKVLLAGMCQSLLNIKSLVHRLYRSSLCHSGISICTSINEK